MNLTIGGTIAMGFLIAGFIGVVVMWVIRSTFLIFVNAYENKNGTIKNPIVRVLKKFDTLMVIAIPFSVFMAGVGLTFIVSYLHI